MPVVSKSKVAAALSSPAVFKKSTSVATLATESSLSLSEASSDDDVPNVNTTNKKNCISYKDEVDDYDDVGDPIALATSKVQNLIHATVTGPLVMIGFGSIGRGVLPLIERHIHLTDRESFVVIEPSDEFVHILKSRNVRHLQAALTPQNYEGILRSLFPSSGVDKKKRGGMIVNVSVDVESVAIMALAQELGVLYIDTVVEAWPGVYFDSTLSNAERTNYALREKMLEVGRKYHGGPTAVTCCGANPGMVSWFMKEALLRIARDTGVEFIQQDENGTTEGEYSVPKTREEWAKLAMNLGVKGVHIAERDTSLLPS